MGKSKVNKNKKVRKCDECFQVFRHLNSCSKYVEPDVTGANLTSKILEKLKEQQR